MIVSELIDELGRYNSDALVTTPYSETVCLSYICEDDNDNPISADETSVVFIEGCDIDETVDD